MSISFWNLSRISAALSMSRRDHMTPLQGLYLEADSGFPKGDQSICSISTDTRTMQRGDCFVALIGERFDGHDLLAFAAEKGAGALVVSSPPPLGLYDIPVFVVEDTLTALGALATYWRTAWGGKVIAVAGSNGKTSTKELIAAVLREKYSVHSTIANHNNRVGVPLTLLDIPASADLAVVEMGTSLKGEIEQLREISHPTVAVITGIGEEHLEGFGDLDGVLEEEVSICDGVDGVIAPSEFPDLLKAARELTDTVVSVGLDEGDIAPDSWNISPNGIGSLRFSDIEVRSPFRGIHNLKNSLLAVAVGRAFGLSDAEIATGISRAVEPDMRGQWQDFSDLIVINDAYNANPASMRASLTMLSGAEHDTKVVILGDMRELGNDSDSYHDEIAGIAIAMPLDIIAAVGAMANAFKRVAPLDPRLITADNVDDLWTVLQPRLKKTSLVLVKASRGVRLERIISNLQSWATT